MSPVSDPHFIRGQANMRLRCSLPMIVMLARPGAGATPLNPHDQNLPVGGYHVSAK